MDLASVITAQTDNFTSVAKEARTAFKTNDTAVQENLGGAQTIYNTIAQDQATVKAAEVAAEKQTQAATARVVTSLGADPKNPANILVKLAEQKAASDEATRQSYDELHRRANLGPTDDFLGFLSAQLYGVGEARGKFRENLGKSQLLDEQVAKTQQFVQNSQFVFKAGTEAITTASAEAAVRIAASEANLRAKQVAIESAKYGNEALLRNLNLTKEELNIAFQTVNANMAAQQYDLALKHFKLSEDRFAWDKEEKKIRDEAILEGKQMEEHVLDNINAGNVSLGLAPYDAKEAKFVIAQFKAGREDLIKAYNRGRATKALGIPIVGTSAADTVDTLTAHPEAVIPEGRKVTLKVIDQANQDVMSQAKYRTEKNKAVIEKAINDRTDQLLEQQYRQVTRDPDNVFNPGDLKQYLGSKDIPAPFAIRVSPIYTKLLQPLANSGADLSDPRVVLEATKEAVRKKTLTYEEAVDLSTVYRQVVMLNLQIRGFKSYGVHIPDDGRGLNVKTGYFGGTTDLTDPVAVSNWLSNELTKLQGVEPGRTERDVRSITGALPPEQRKR